MSHKKNQHGVGFSRSPRNNLKVGDLKCFKDNRKLEKIS